MNIYDRLYKKMVFPKIIYDLLDCPGLLRLKEVRMANNPFVAFPSFSTASRYEHSLGVCYLAGICADKLQLKEKDKLELMIAALYHDVGTPPFAHAMEEVLQAKFGFDHEVNLFNLITGKTDSFDQELAQIFCGSSLKLRSVCQQESAVKLGIDVTRIAKIAVGSPDEVLSPILNSKGMDLDNIDNIFRASTAMGILDTDGGELAKTLAKAFVISGDRVAYDWQRYTDQILYWQKVRDLQYTAIFESTEDFAYQTMIKESINKLSVQDESGIKLDKDLWRLTDHIFTYEYLLKHSKSRDIMTRVMLCKPYSCIAILYISGRNTSKFINTHLSQIGQVASAYYDSVIHPKDKLETSKAQPSVGQAPSIIANFYPDKRKREIDATAIPGGGDAPSSNPEGSDAALLGLFTPHAANGYSTKLADNGEKKRVKTVFRKENLEQLIYSLIENIFQNYHVSVYRGDVDGKFEEDIEANQLGLF